MVLSLHKQKGDFLVESLIGMVLLAIIGVGVVTIASKVSISQKDTNVQTLAINQMRTALMTNGIDGHDVCANTPTVTLPGAGTVAVSVQGCTSSLNAKTSAVISNPDTNSGMASVTVTDVPRPIVISARSGGLPGEVIVGGEWETTTP